MEPGKLLDTFIPLFVAIDIFAVLPVFISLTEGLKAERKRYIISQSVLTALFVSVAFAAFGKGIFGILGIEVDDFKVAGGLVLLVLATLEIARRDGSRPRPSETAGVVPIGVPLIVGPAVLTTVLVLIDNYGVLYTLISLVLNLLIVWVSFLSANRIVRFMGKSGVVALSKIMALLLASIAIKMIRLGIENIIKG